MENAELFLSVLESLDMPLVLVDANHQIRYSNSAGRRQYSRFGDITGKSIFECHNDKSRQMILQIFAQLQEGANEILYLDKQPKKYFMKSIRDSSGRLLGYYERIENQSNTAEVH